MMFVVLDDRRFIPFGLLITLALWSMLIVVVGHIELPFVDTPLIA